MAISKTSDLFLLIKTLTKSEKRSFRLYAERIQGSDQLVYMKLFDILDKESKPDDKKIMSTLGIREVTKYSNYKRHLFEQLMVSLRMVKKSNNANFKVRELIDFAYVLYGKGFHIIALKTLKRAKAMAKKSELDFALITIYEFEKRIHSRHITRINSEILEELLEEAESLTNSINNRVTVSNLSMIMHRVYINNGHVKNEEEEKLIREKYAEKIMSLDVEEFNFKQLIHYYQTLIWFYYILNDFEATLSTAKDWVALFDPENVSKLDTHLYFRANQYLLSSLYNLKRIREFETVLEGLEKFRKSKYGKFEENTKILSFITVHQGRLNKYILNNDYTGGIKAIPRTLRRLSRYGDIVDNHKVLIFYFKIAWIYLMDQKPGKAVNYIQSIINQSQTSLREDIQVYTRLMNIMAQVDLENFLLLPSMIRNYKRYIEKYDMMQESHKWFLDYVKSYISKPILERKELTHKYISLLDSNNENKYERRVSLYLDLTLWMRTKL